MQLKTYPAKVLLFGEYTVLFGGQALAVPYFRYQGQWAKTSSGAGPDFENLWHYLNRINQQLMAPLNLDQWRAMLADDYAFDSNIPQGMGLGSSGALAASLYDLLSNPSELTLEERKNDLALIESFYHGKSSGFDALISLQKKCIIQSSSGLKQLKEINLTHAHLYLLYTDRQRHTQKLVTHFQTACKEALFRKEMEKLALESQQAIELFINGLEWVDTLFTISFMQFKYLDFLIVPELKTLWQDALHHRNFFLKICGAGGGGCYLIVSTDKISGEELSGFKIEEIIL